MIPWAGQRGEHVMRKLHGVKVIIATFMASQSMMYAQTPEIKKTEQTSGKGETKTTAPEQTTFKEEQSKEQEQTTATKPKATKEKRGNDKASADAKQPKKVKVVEDQNAEPKPENQSSVTRSGVEQAVGKSEDGRTTYEESKGGHYYLKDNGDKVYVNDLVDAKIVGKTASGKTIYKGPRGGHFYYSDNGNKVYIKKK
ncbi:MAG TPA: hypothetical protein DGH68_02850 [Bacteroidetes bacterium]|nr:hypothetical protein [Bacteroidota bacterium]